MLARDRIDAARWRRFVELMDREDVNDRVDRSERQSCAQGVVGERAVAGSGAATRAGKRFVGAPAPGRVQRQQWRRRRDRRWCPGLRRRRAVLPTWARGATRRLEPTPAWATVPHPAACFRGHGGHGGRCAAWSTLAQTLPAPFPRGDQPVLRQIIVPRAPRLSRSTSAMLSHPPSGGGRPVPRHAAFARPPVRLALPPPPQHDTCAPPARDPRHNERPPRRCCGLRRVDLSCETLPVLVDPAHAPLPRTSFCALPLVWLPRHSPPPQTCTSVALTCVGVSGTR